MKNEGIVVHTDGGSRGNPGPAACAFVVEDNELKIYKGSKYLGIQTNNYAEYQGVILALNWLTSQSTIKNPRQTVFFYLDSELVVKQINGFYKVKDTNLKKLFVEIVTMLKKFDNNILFKNIRRENNKVADFLVNEELDRNV